MFHHTALSRVLIDAIWPPRGKLYKLIDSPGVDFDKLISYTTAMLRWALDNHRKGSETSFEVSEYKPIYNQALKRIVELREAGNGADLDNMIREIRAMGQAHADQYSD